MNPVLLEVGVQQDGIAVEIIRILQDREAFLKLQKAP